jgi:hypothetical protein
MRKCTIWVVTILVALAFSAEGCKKKEAAAPKTPDEAAYQFRLTLGTVSPQVRNLYYDKVDSNVRYGKYQEASAALEQIISDPSLNEQQKKLATQLKDMLQANPANPAHP